jgi:hypothetical protein
MRWAANLQPIAPVLNFSIMSVTVLMSCCTAWWLHQLPEAVKLSSCCWVTGVQVLEKDSHKAPWKYINTISVEQLSFGLLPPTFQGEALQCHAAIGKRTVAHTRLHQLLLLLSCYELLG